MITGSLGTKLYFNTPIFLNNPNRIELKNSLIDYIRIENGLVGINDIDLDKWNFDTVVSAQFSSSLYAGNMENESGLPIEKIKIKKRKKGDVVWQNVVELEYDKNKIYSHKDKFVESLETYDYAVQGIVGNMMLTEQITEVNVEFDGIWIMGASQSFKLEFNEVMNEISNNVTYNTITTLGSKYPFIIKNSAVNYKTFECSGMIVSKSSDELSFIDKFEEKKLRNVISKFLSDGEPKIIKSDSGEYVLSMVTNLILTPRNDLGRYIYEVSFTVTEIDDVFDEEVLRSYGFIE